MGDFALKTLEILLRFGVNGFLKCAEFFEEVELVGLSVLFSIEVLDFVSVERDVVLCVNSLRVGLVSHSSVSSESLFDVFHLFSEVLEV